MGRWSRLAADKFLGWLHLPPALHWLDLGCGTGALSAAVIEHADPASVLACDPSQSLLEVARSRLQDARVAFQVGTARDLQLPGKLDVFVSGLVLNFIEDPRDAVEAISPSLSPGGTAAAYVWDYSDGMGFLRAFWDAATALNPDAADLDEGIRFPLCAPEPLRLLFENVRLKNIEVVPLEISTEFRNFSDYWEPLLGGTGPAPSYVSSLSEDERHRLGRALRGRLSPRGEGGFILGARAWAVRGST